MRSSCAVEQVVAFGQDGLSLRTVKGGHLLLACQLVSLSARERRVISERC